MFYRPILHRLRDTISLSTLVASVYSTTLARNLVHLFVEQASWSKSRVSHNEIHLLSNILQKRLCLKCRH